MLLAGALAMVVGFFVVHENWYQWFPDTAGADKHLALANDLYFRRAFASAESEYKLATVLAPKRGEDHYRSAWNLYQGGKPSEAVQQMYLAQHFSDRDEKIEVQLADMMRGNQQLEEAAIQYGKCATFYPQKSDYFHGLQATCLKEAGKPEKALPLFQRVAADVPKDEIAWSKSVECLEILGKRQEAVSVAREALKHVPASSFLHFKLGSLLSEQSNKAEAILELRKSADLDPSTTEYVSNFIGHITDNGKLTNYLIPLRKNGRSLTTEAVLNGKIRLTLIVDSGAESCVIPTKTAKALGIDLEQCSKATIKSVTGTTEAYQVTLQSMRVGSAESQNIHAWVYNYKDDNADGLLGMTFLEHYTFSIDAEKCSLSLSPKFPNATQTNQKHSRMRKNHK